MSTTVLIVIAGAVVWVAIAIFVVALCKTVAAADREDQRRQDQADHDDGWDEAA